MERIIQTIADEYVKDEKFCGIEWQIEKDNHLLCKGKSGYSNFKLKSPVPESALYRIYSMTKPIISVLALKLIEIGKLKLNDPISKYDSRFNSMAVLYSNGTVEQALSQISIEHLLTHKAGFSYDFLLGCQIAPFYRHANLIEDGSRDLTDMVEIISEQPLAFHPGSDWRYSVATDVLAHIIELATDSRLDLLLKQHIFDPLNMSETTYCLSEVQKKRLMSIYGKYSLHQLPKLSRPKHLLEEQNVTNSYPSSNPNFRRGGIGLFSTIEDYSKFTRMLLTGQSIDGETLLSSSMLRLFRANRSKPHELPLRISDVTLPGYGWNLIGRTMVNLSLAVKPSSLGEFGWSGAGNTYFWVDPSENISGVIMTQFLGSHYPLEEDIQWAIYKFI